MVSLHQECISYIKQRPPQSKYHNKPYAYNWTHCQSPPTSKSHNSVVVLLHQVRGPLTELGQPILIFIQIVTFVRNHY